MRRLLLILGACLALAVAGCGSSSSTTSESPASSSSEETTAPKETESTKKKTKPKVTVPQGAPPKKLETKDLEKGSGATAKAGDAVSVNYVGVNYKTGKEFDASWDRGEPFTFTLGAGEVIPGWDQGVAGMKVGGRRRITIPPDLAYGKRGAGGVIGPDETLVFVVALIGVR